jgi:hypothetical protein
MTIISCSVPFSELPCSGDIFRSVQALLVGQLRHRSSTTSLHTETFMTDAKEAL